MCNGLCQVNPDEGSQNLFLKLSRPTSDVSCETFLLPFARNRHLELEVAVSMIFPMHFHHNSLHLERIFIFRLQHQGRKFFLIFSNFSLKSFGTFIAKNVFTAYLSSPLKTMFLPFTSTIKALLSNIFRHKHS